jgi:hypothetical protein
MIEPTWITPEAAEHHKHVMLFRQLKDELGFNKAFETSVNLTLYALQVVHVDMRAELLRDVIAQFQELVSHVEKGERLNDHNVQ